MKQFFKFMFASMVGFILTILIVSVIFVSIIASLISMSKNDTVNISANTVLCVKCNQQVEDRSSSDPSSVLFNKKTTGLLEILKSIRAAKTDSKIKGIYMELDQMNVNITNVEEIRNALIDFKTSKKFVISYAENYSQKAYYLATVSDNIILNPEGILGFRGLSSTHVFFKGALQKLEIEAQIIRHGKFKSAVEPFMLDKMSSESREQTKQFVGSIWNHLLTGISATRKLSFDELNFIADSLILGNSESALKRKMVDNIMFKDEVLEKINELLKAKKDAKINFVTLPKYIKTPEFSKVDSKNSVSTEKIAVIYASGDIVSGEGENDEIGSSKFSSAIRDARLDKNIKAIVLRINSPGGSALASEIIYREVTLAKKVKPVVVSMGGVAASGGYYIACPADKIIASQNTITGSIGVFGIIFNAKKMFNDKLGITFDNVNTNKYSDIGSMYKPLSNFEKMKIQNEIERIYETFISHVAEGRKLTKAQVDSIGQGRVWSGVDAKRIGLIDDFGGIEKAIDVAAGLAKLKKYKLVSLPKQKEKFEQIIEMLTDAEETKIKNELGEYYKFYNYLKEIPKMERVQARLPYFMEIE